MGSAPLASTADIRSRERECGPVQYPAMATEVLLEALNKGDVVNSSFARFGDDRRRMSGNSEVS